MLTLKTVATIVEEQPGRARQEVPDEVVTRKLTSSDPDGSSLGRAAAVLFISGVRRAGARPAVRRGQALLPCCFSSNMPERLQLGLLLFLLAAGLTLVFGIMDLVNLAHGSLYMIGAYFAATFTALTGSFLSASRSR
jgi:hypothetical protein